jgi:hypothetical protein
MFTFGFDIVLIKEDLVGMKRDFEKECLGVSSGTLRTLSNKTNILRRGFRLDGSLIGLYFL